MRFMANTNIKKTFGIPHNFGILHKFSILHNFGILHITLAMRHIILTEEHINIIHIILTEEHINIIHIILTEEHMNIIPEHFEHIKLWMEEVIIHIILLKGDIQFFSQLLNIPLFLRIFPKVRIRYIYLSKLMEYTRLFLNIFLLVRNQRIYPNKRVERTQSNTLFGNTLVLFFLLEQIQYVGRLHIPKWFFHKAYIQLCFLLLLIESWHYLFIQSQ